MKKILFFSAAALLLAACGKDKFESKPHLKIKSVNTHEVAANQTLSVLLEFTDKEGDVSDSFLIIRQRLNQNGPLLMDPLPYKLPEFPATSKGEIEVNLGYI